MFWFVAPWPRLFGVAAVVVRSGLTVKQPVQVPVAPPLLLLTMMLRRPVAAFPAMLMFAVSCVALLKVVELTVILVPEKLTVAPLTKFVPVITIT